MSGGGRQGPPKHQNKYAWKPNAGVKINETEVGGRFRPLSEVTGVCLRCKEQIEWKRKYGKYKPLTEPAKCQRCSKRAVRQAYHNLCNACAKEHNVCAKCSCRVERIIGRDSSEVEAEQKSLEEAISNARERERRTLLRAMNKGTSRGSKAGNLFTAASLEEYVQSLSTYLLLMILLTFIFFISTTFLYPQLIYKSTTFNSHVEIILPYSLHHRISHLQTEMGNLLEQLHSTGGSERQANSKFSDQVLHIAVSLDKLADSLSSFYSNAPAEGNEMSNVDEEYSEPEEREVEEGSFNERVFSSAELRNYTSPKPNRLSGKKNFLGLEAIYPSIGLGCAGVAADLERYMTYKSNGICPDDWDLAQKLIVAGCDPLPRRRCFSRTPPHYSKSLPGNSSLWTQPSDANIRWNLYKCKGYTCLVSNDTIGKRGFYKCSDCFDLSKRGWEVPTDTSVSAEFTIEEVLGLKAGEIRIGLDFGPTAGTFAAMMREKNVTVASATLNLGAPFNEVIALRGLLPLYISVGSRLPFFDNTLDLIHSTLFLDGWVGMELLQYVLFDWDRVLRPEGLLWLDRFFCKKEEMELYLDSFNKLGYRKLLWRVVPKTDRLNDELFFSAVLEKPRRS
ncbi:hypothetical protein RJ639_036788 [Escallonia herrerae]|uniref:Uncharacterized protein n=1 Tax=Escallonia herrerae TaxID=1293975 RepID=A0AA89B7C9_9ASTE|nr:hypothetical protein RJ639_036788 [Escallonia herrerae]